MKLDTFRKNLDKMTKGHIVMSISYTTDYIAWLWKYRKISESEMSEMCEKVEYILKYCV